MWQPPLIKVPSGALTIKLVNTLHIPITASTTFNDVPTSLVIVGQVGGGLGDVTKRTTMPSPAHAPQGTTWPGTPGGTDVRYGDAVFTPPPQPDRVRSFATEVKYTDGTTGQGSLEQPASGHVPDRVRHGALDSGADGSVRRAGRDGCQLSRSGRRPDVALLLSEIDPVQNTAVQTAVQTAGFDDKLVWSGQTGKCGDPAVHTCYPPAVNYSPLYYLINGVSFNRRNPDASALNVPASGASGNVLLRLVNAGLRMHVPAVVGANMTLLAEDGNKLPGVPKVQSEVFLAAGKTYDVTIQPKQASGKLRSLRPTRSLTAS